MKRIIVFGILVLIASMVIVIAEDTKDISQLTTERQRRITFGHVMLVENIHTDPSNIVPGRPAKLNLKVENTGTDIIKDIRVQIGLPDEILFFEDISKRKISKIYSEESWNLSYDIIAVPGASEGVYEASITVDYLNYIGDERQDNDTFGIIIKSEPDLFASIESSEIYKENYIGEVTIRFVNNDVADIKFLTVELQDSADYKILGVNKKYVGDLDSDDFESVSFRVKADKGKERIAFPLNINYKDSLNNDYEEDLEVYLDILGAKEAGVKRNNTILILFVIVVIIVAGYYFYKKYKKKLRGIKLR